MKEASGELNMTVVTIVAIAAILGFFVAMWGTEETPGPIQRAIRSQWEDLGGVEQE